MTDKTKELYEETVASQLKVWDDEIDHLDARADILLAQVEERYYTLLKSLRIKEHEVRERLAQLRSARDDDWDALRTDIVATTNEMRRAISRAMEELELSNN